ncbi:MAG TPA: dTDP-4-dehydrorhamnose reductase [Rhodanobacteraceae bacterium]|nr:dTDP-4-dehydrorhamnose reductase [Rhodanobacteraceae bacterium]
MKILVLGANGQVGCELMRALAPLGEVVAATRDGARDTIEADLARPDSLADALDAVDAEIVVNAAAYTAVDRAEDESSLADRINHRAVAGIGAWAAAKGAGVIHYSTDYVFDGSAKRPYREDDPTAPLGVYGRTKLDGEDALRASGARHLILRTAWVYAARGRNFLLTMLRLAGERDELRVVDDQVGAPTPARLIADATAEALASWHVSLETRDARFDGIHHLVSRGKCSWCDFAGAIMAGAAKRGLVARAPRVVPIRTSEYPTRAKRPAYSVLDTERFEGAFGLQLPDWRAGLDQVLDELAATR